MNPLLVAILERQDQLITRRQASPWLSEEQIDEKLGRHWQVLMPGVYAAFTGQVTHRQRLRGALLHAGETAMLSDTTALHLYQVPYLPADSSIRLLVDASVQRTSRDGVVIRRSARLPQPFHIDGFPVAPPCRAVAELALRLPDERDSLAVAAAALQRGKLTLEELIMEARLGPARGRPRLVRVIDELSAGMRSAPESDFRRLVLGSRILSEPLWNPLIELPDGTKISPDGLFLDAGLISEVNGRGPHAGEDAFEDMQRRHDALVAAGFTVVHNSPRRLRAEPLAVISQLEVIYERAAGSGLPPGVRILRFGPPGIPSNVALPVPFGG